MSRRTFVWVLLIMGLAGVWLSPLWMTEGDPSESAPTSAFEFLPLHPVQEVVAPIEDIQRFLVAPGFTCVRTESDPGTVLRHDGNHLLPDWAEGATVILNGWRLRYLKGDHQVKGVFVELKNVRRERDGQLRWTARGRLYDRNGDDGYEFCYNHTVVAWKTSVFSAFVRNAPSRGRRFQIGGLLEREIIEDFRPSSPPGEALLVPRYYEAFFDEQPLAPDDSEIQQFAFTRTSIPSDPVTSPDELRWKLQVILKQDGSLKKSRPFWAEEQLSIIHGGSVVAQQQPFELQPKTDSKPWYQRCTGFPNGARKVESFTIENIVAEHAVPVLSGFGLAYTCGEQHVTEIGARIIDFRYERAAGATTGRLHYRLESVLRDKSGPPNHQIQPNVQVLGFRPTPFIVP